MKAELVVKLYGFGLSLVSLGVGGWSKNPWIGLVVFGGGVLLSVFMICLEDESGGGEN